MENIPILQEDILTCAYDKSSYEKYIDFITQKSDVKLYAAYVDIDGLKQINDKYSLSTGDNCVILVASRLKKVSKQLFRVGGEEFVFFVSEEETSVLDKIPEIRKQIATLYIESGKNILSVSIGVSDKGLACNIIALVNQAKDRMKKAKNLQEIG